jgi:hypothetical protein
MPPGRDNAGLCPRLVWLDAPRENGLGSPCYRSGIPSAAEGVNKQSTEAILEAGDFIFSEDGVVHMACGALGTHRRIKPLFEGGVPVRSF